ncbi:MAG: hypothetical protein FWD23_06385 [Oscillospiraceae bacterium]|nr:hypothetical protein [Oscillospiraceae bacterium]
MQKNEGHTTVFALFLAAIMMLSSCEAATTNDDGDFVDMPPLEISDTHLSIDKFDAFKETYVGGTRGGSIYYAGNPTILSYEISEPSVVSFEFTELYIYAEVGLESSVSQNFEITGLKPGRATVTITFAEGHGDPNATVSIEVVVFDEMWLGSPYHGDYSIQTFVGGTNGGSFSYAGNPAILSYEISDSSVVSFEFAGISVHTYDKDEFEDHIVQNYEVTGLKTGRATVTITFADGNDVPYIIEVVAFDEIWPGYPYQNESYKETYAGGTNGGSIYYAGRRKRLSYEISDPSVVSFEFAFSSVHAHYDHYDVNGHYDENELEYSVSQNFEITGLKPGRAIVTITFAFPEEGDPYAIALIEVVVYDEIWPR